MTPTQLSDRDWQSLEGALRYKRWYFEAGLTSETASQREKDQRKEAVDTICRLQSEATEEDAPRLHAIKATIGLEYDGGTDNGQ